MTMTRLELWLIVGCAISAYAGMLLGYFVRSCLEVLKRNRPRPDPPASSPRRPPLDEIPRPPLELVPRGEAAERLKRAQGADELLRLEATFGPRVVCAAPNCPICRALKGEA